MFFTGFGHLANNLLLFIPTHGASLVAQSVKNLPAVQEAWVRSLDQEDPLEREMATHSSTVSWRISWTEGPGGLQSMGSQRVGHDWVTNTYYPHVAFGCLETNAVFYNIVYFLTFSYLHISKRMKGMSLDKTQISDTYTQTISSVSAVCCTPQNMP